MCRKLENHIKNKHHDDWHKPCKRYVEILLHFLVTFVNLQTHTFKDCVLPVVIKLYVSLIQNAVFIYPHTQTLCNKPQKHKYFIPGIRNPEFDLLICLLTCDLYI